MKLDKDEITAVIVEEIRRLPADKLRLVQSWSNTAVAITSNTALSRKEKLLRLRKLETSDVVKLLLLELSRRLKVSLWDQRGWGARLALSGLAVGVIAGGTEAAGIAALGSAIGLPFFLLTTAGGALLGTLVQELGRPPNPESNTDDAET
jgi:hypothetical protein